MHLFWSLVSSDRAEPVVRTSCRLMLDAAYHGKAALEEVVSACLSRDSAIAPSDAKPTYSFH
jgi:hypothetical protein